MSRFLHHLWRPGMRLQVLCWYTAVFTIVLLLAGAISYHYFENALESSVETSLHIQAQQIATEIVAGKDTIVIHDATGVLSDLSAPSSFVPAVDVNYGALVRLLDSRGQVLRETPACRKLLIPAQSMTQALAGHAWEGTIKTTDDQEVQWYSQALTTQGKAFAVLQVGLSLTSQHQVLRQLVTLLLIVGALALLLCALSSYWLAARSFRPVRKATQTAQRIQAGDLRQRVPLPQAHDEIYDLALTFNEMLDTLEQTMLRQQRFVADASHELRTPVAVIRNKASIALLQPQTRRHYETVLQEITAETERLGHLISDLLVLARGDEGRARFEREPVRFDLLTRATVSSAQALAEERAIRLTVEAEKPVTLKGDEARLMQVVLNLVENALCYTDPGGTVQVEVTAQKDAAYLLVRDTGKGIAPQHLPHLFERFYRADPSRRQTRGNNSGLGLAIVEWIVRLHGGTITVASDVGKGSCFCVQIPLDAISSIKEGNVRSAKPS